MKLNTFTAILLSTTLAATTVPALAQDAAETPREGRGFAAMDTNGDGTISKEEFSGNLGTTLFEISSIVWVST